MPRGQQGKKAAKEDVLKSPKAAKQKTTKPKEAWEKKVTKIKLVSHIPLQRAVPKSIEKSEDGSPYKRDVFERHFKRGRDGELEQKSIREHKKNSFRTDSDEVSNNNGRSDEAHEESSCSCTGRRLEVDGSYSSSQPSSPSSSSVSPCVSTQISFLVDPINDSKIPPMEAWDVIKRISPGKREGKDTSDAARW